MNLSVFVASRERLKFCPKNQFRDWLVPTLGLNSLVSLPDLLQTEGVGGGVGLLHLHLVGRLLQELPGGQLLHHRLQRGLLGRQQPVDQWPLLQTGDDPGVLQQV